MIARKILIGAVICFVSAVLAAAEDLLPRHKQWLDDMAPIMTRTERDVFLKLRTAEERDKFIRFFWRQRDPLPDTAENEFQKEYLARIRFADDNFGYGTSKRGSQTERGYHYLLLGPPLERHMFTTYSQVWPCELWYYKGEQQYGLPPYFYLIFYQPQGLGEYRLYNPGVEGPEKLAIPSLYSSIVDRGSAHAVIKKISSELAAASLSYLPSDATLGMSSFSSSAVVSGIRSLPEKKFSDVYARSYLRYKDYVETEYSDNFIDCGYKVKIFMSSGQPFLHWAIEPKKINFAADAAGRYYASYELVLRMEDTKGNLVYEKTEEIPLRITPEQYKSHEQRIFSLQDILPVIPGTYRLFFLLKNKTGKDFSSFSAEVRVPDKKEAPALGDLLLYHAQEPAAEAQKKMLKAFTFGGRTFYINSRTDYFLQAGVGVYVQIRPAESGDPAQDSTALLEIRPADGGEAAVRMRKASAEILTPGKDGLDFGIIPLSKVKPGYYQVEVTLLGADGVKLASSRETFSALSLAYPAVPWVYARLHPAFPDPESLFALGSQCFMTQRYEEARELSEQALKMKDEPGTRLLLGKSFFALNRFQDSLTVIVPLYESGRSREAAKVIALDYAGLKDWSSALVYLEKLMAEATEIGVLNLAAECHLNLNQPDRAVPLLRKSLELKPDQLDIRERLAKIDKK